MRYSELARILSPLMLFFTHIVYLLFISNDQFLQKWIEGCFTFFLALVLCNIIRARVVAAKGQGASADKEIHGSDGQGEDGDA
jgi:hypothetical protein